jgi:hypothetical protein
MNVRATLRSNSRKILKRRGRGERPHATRSCVERSWHNVFIECETPALKGKVSEFHKFSGRLVQG